MRTGSILSALVAALFVLAGCQEVVVHRDPAPGGSGPPPPPPMAGPVARGGPPPHAPAHGYRRKFQYIHYPASNVYYAPDRSRYFWIEAGNWRVGTRLPDHIVINRDEGISLELSDDTPYAHHARSRR